MSNSVDEKVVSLKFDNSKFEDNAQQALTTLQKLKEALDFNNLQNAKGLDKLGAAIKNTDFSVMAQGIENVSRRFSVMGIAGMRVIQDITDSVLGLGKRLVNFIPGQIKSGGISRSLKLEQAKFQLEGLGKVWDQNSKGFKKGMTTMKDAVLDAINTTSYGIGEAANVASQLSASGIKISEMTGKLKAVAGVAAMTGASFEDAGRIFIQTAGQGRLMGKQLQELSMRGLNAAKTLSDYVNKTKGAKESIINYAKATGKYNKVVKDYAKTTRTTEADIRNLASAGAISFNMFSDAMEKAFGEHAAKANDTFTGSLMNMKAAFSRIGSEVATTQLVNLRYVFNQIREAVYNALYVIFPFIEAINKISVLLSQKLYTALDKLNRKLNKNRSALKDWATNSAKYTNNAAGIWKKFDKKLKKEHDKLFGTTENTAKKSEKSLKKLSKAHRDASKTIGISAKEYKAAMDIWNKGSYGTGATRKKNLESIGLSYKRVQKAVNELVKSDFNLKKSHLFITDAENKRSGSTKRLANAAKKAAKAHKDSAKQVRVNSKELQAAMDIWYKGSYGNGAARKKNLKAVGLSYKHVQRAVNELVRTDYNLKKANIVVTDSEHKKGKATGKSNKHAKKSKKANKDAEKSAYGWSDALSSVYKGLKNVFGYIKKIVEPVGAAFKETFTFDKGSFKNGIFGLVQKFEKATSKLKPSEETLTNMHDTFKGLFDVVLLVKDALVELFRAAFPVTETASSFGSLILSITGAIGRFLSALADTIRKHEIIQKVAGGIGKVIRFIVDLVKNVNKVVRSFINYISTSPGKKIQQFFGKIKKGFNTLRDFAKNLVKWPIDKLKEFSKKVEEAASWTQDEFTKAMEKYAVPAMKKFSNKVKEAVNWLKEFEKKHKIFATIKSVSSSAFDTVKMGAKKAFEKVKELFDEIKNSEFVKSMKDEFKELGGVLKDFGKVILETVIDKFNQLKQYFTDIHFASRFKDSFKDMLDSAVDFTKGFTESLKPIKDSVKPLEDVKKALDPSTLSTYAGQLGNLDLNFAKNEPITQGLPGHDQKPNDTYKNLIQFLKDVKNAYESSGVPQVINDIKKKIAETFENSEWDLDKAIDRGLGITKMIATLKLVKQSQSIVSSTQGLMKSFGGIFDAAARAISSYGNLGSELANASKAVKKHMKFESLKAFAVAVALIAASVYILAKLSVDELKKGIVAVGLISGLMMLVLKVVSNPNLDDSKLKAAGIAFVSMGGSLLMIAAAAKIFGGMKIPEMAKAGLALAAFVGIFVASANLLKKDPAGMLSFAALAIGVTLLIPAIKLMSKMKVSTLARGGAAIFAFVVMIGLAARAAGKNKGGFAAFLGLSAAVATLVPAIVILSMLPLEKSLKAAATLSLILIALGRAIKISNSGNGTLNVAFAFAVSAMIGSLTVSLIALSLVPFDKLMKSVVALGAVMGALAAATHFMKDAKADLGLIVVVLGAMSGMVYIMGTVNSETAAVNMAAMSGLLLSLTAVCEILKRGTMTFGAAAKTLGIISMWLVGIVAVITALQTALGYIAENTNIEKHMERGIKMAGLIGEFIGAFVGGLAGGFAIYGLEAIAHGLANFATSMQPFFEFASTIDSDTVKGVKNLGEAVLFITGASILNKLNSGPINSFYGGGMVEFANDLGRLMESLSKIDFTNAPTEEETKGVSAAIKGLGEAAAAIPPQGGLRGFILGIQDLADFGEELGSFITSMNGDGGWLSKVPETGEGNYRRIRAVSEAIKALGEAADSVPASTTSGNISISQMILGLQDLSDFGTELAAFMPEFNEALKTMVGSDDAKSYMTPDNLERIKNVGKVIEALGEAVQAVPKNLDDESIQAKLTGFTNLQSFADGLSGLGEIMPGLIDASSTLDKGKTSKIKMMAGAIEALAESADAVKKAGPKVGDEGKATTDLINRLADFAGKLPDFATKFSTFATEAAKIKAKDLTAASGVASAFKTLADAYKALYDSKAFSANGGDMASKITALGEAIKSYAENVNGLDVSNIEKNTAAVSASIGEVGAAMADEKGNFKDAAKTSISGYAEGLADSNATTVATTNAAAVRKAVIDTLKGNEYAQYKSVGANAVKSGYATGLLAAVGSSNSAGAANGRSAASGMKSADFYSSGYNAALGFQRGLASANSLVYSAGAALGQAAKRGLDSMKGLDVNSPSKKFRKSGHSGGEGLILGLKDYANKVYKEGAKTGEQAVKGANTGVGRIIDEINDPTITPVLDLSQLKKDAGQMNTLLSSTNPRINPSLVDASLNRQNESIDVDKLAAKLDKFAEKMSDNKPSNVYTIGDVSVDVSKLEDVTTLNDFVSMLRHAKAFN